MAASPDFAAVRATPAWRQQLAVFWRWWADEISRLVPERFAVFRGGSRAPALALEGDDVTLIEPRGAAPAQETKAALGALDEARRKSAVRALLERAGETRGRARLALGRDEVLVRRVTMPAATEENLAQVLAFEMDRLTPFKAEEVYFDHRLISRDPTTGQILVQLAVARRELVDARVARLRELGASVQGVTARDDLGHAGAPFDLLPSEQRGERESSRERLIQRALIAGVVALLALALLLPVWQKRETIIALHPLLGKAKQDAEATDAVARELERQVGDYNFLLAKKHGTYPALAYVEEITRLLPDSTWVQQLDIKTLAKGREVQIQGETLSASKLIEILEQSALLQNAAPRGNVVRGSSPGNERFMIAAETRARPLPESRPAMEMISAVPPPAPAAPPAPQTVIPAAPAPEAGAAKAPAARPAADFRAPAPKPATPAGK